MSSSSGAWHECSSSGPDHAGPPQSPQPGFDEFYDAEDEAFEDFEHELDVLINFPDMLEALSEAAPAEDAAAASDDHAISKVEPSDRSFRLKLNMKIQHKFKELWKPQHILLKDKVAFLIGCSLLWGCAFWLGCSPESFYKLYTFLGLALFAIRYITYRRRKYHYYLFDFCYWANFLLLLYLWVLPHSSILQQATFAFNTGPLTWSILAFRNSLVFHDMDKVTSLFLHLVPALVSWSLHWYPEDDHFQARPGLGLLPAAAGGPAAACSTTPASFNSSSSSGSDAMAAGGAAAGPWRCHTKLLGFIGVPMSLYLVWAFLYYLKIFVFSAKKIQQRGYQTLFNYVTTQKHGAFYELSKRIPQSMHTKVYLFLHLCFCFCTLLVALPCWYFYAGHTALLIMITSSSIWSGSSYYFEVFAKRYHASIAEALKQA